MKHTLSRLIARLSRRFLRPLAAASTVLPWLFAAAVAGAQAPAASQNFGPDALEQIRLLQMEKAQLAPHQRKIDSRLRRMLDATSPSPKFPGLAALRRPAPQADGTIALDVDTFTGGDVKAVIEVVEAAGGTVVFPSAEYRTVRARVAPAAIEALALVPGVRFVTLAREAITNKVNTSQGDVTHRAAAARSFFGYDGTGVKVCVLSDGVSSLASVVATGDLPPGVDVLPGQAGSGDEGTAMLEIVHDLAPGAPLGFATAFISEASFAANIVALKNAGCKIIVDDVSYFDESPFQEGPVVNAVNTVTAAGVLYFSSAANSGNKDHNQSGTWEGDFNPNGTITLPPCGAPICVPAFPGGAFTVHNFGDGGKSIQATATSGNPITLHWNDPFGTSGNDYDMFLMDAALTTIVDASDNVQNGNDIPFEIMGGATAVGQRIVIIQRAGAANRALNLATNRGRLDPTLATAGNVRGHNGSNTTVSVSATPAAGPFGSPPNPTGPYPSPFNATNQAELFTSDGPRRMYFDFAGNFLPGAPVGNYTFAGGVVFQKPDLTAADGVMTAAPGFNPFYGTSAAAPHAAAIAALVKHAFPAMTNTQIRNAMTTNAIDIEAAGWDRVTGTGITMVYETLQALGAAPAAVLSLGTVTPAQIAGNGDAFIDPGEDWKFDITLNNTGAATAYGIVATLVSTTPGVVVTSGPVSYPNIGAAGSAANPGATPFRFSVTSAACGTQASFTLTVNYGGGSGTPMTATIPIGIGGLGSTSTFTYAGGVVPIADGVAPEVPGATAMANLNVAGLSGNVGKVVFKLLGTVCSTAVGATTVGLDHSWVGDLVIKLVAPDATSVTLVNRMGAINNSGNNFCQTTLDDASAGAVIDTLGSASAPFTGSFKPSTPLASFIGKVGNGTWQLQANDWEPTDTGSIRAFALDIRPVACAAPSNPTAMTATKTVSGSFVPGGSVDYTVTISNTGTGTQVDNPGDEFTDTLPAQLAFRSASASSGSISVVGSTVRWNGSIPGGGNVKIVISAEVNPGTTGATVTNQGTVSYDPNHSGTNSSSVLTDDPGVGGAANPTQFVVAAASGLPRTFVASSGNDGNPCTLTSPCRGFQAALALTVPDGEIAVLDAAGYGFVTINKPVTIVSPPGVYAGISIAAGHGIDVNPGAGHVVLRGLTLTGLGGDVGINLMSGDALSIENCVIGGFTNAGVSAIPSAPSLLFIRNSTLRDNGIGALLGTTTGASGPLRAVVEHSRFENNGTGIGFTGATALGTISDTTVIGGTFGLNVNPTTAGAATKVTARKSTFTKAATSGVRVGGAAGTTASASLVRSQVSESGIGVETLTGGTAYVSGTTVVRNTTGVTTASGTAISLGNNQLTRNGTNGTFSATVSTQ